MTKKTAVRTRTENGALVTTFADGSEQWDFNAARKSARTTLAKPTARTVDHVPKPVPAARTPREMVMQLEVADALEARAEQADDVIEKALHLDRAGEFRGQPSRLRSLTPTERVLAAEVIVAEHERNKGAVWKRCPRVSHEEIARLAFLDQTPAPAKPSTPPPAASFSASFDPAKMRAKGYVEVRPGVWDAGAPPAPPQPRKVAEDPDAVHGMRVAIIKSFKKS